MLIVDSGIYEIRSKRFPKRHYIGSSVRLLNRLKDHKCRLKKGNHANQKLQRHVNKYGFEDLEFSIIELVAPADLIPMEQAHIDKGFPYFNICLVAGNTLGRPQSAETRRRRSEALLGKEKSEASKLLMSLAAYQRYPPPRELNGHTLLEAGARTFVDGKRSHKYQCKCGKVLFGPVPLIRKRVCKCRKNDLDKAGVC